MKKEGWSIKKLLILLVIIFIIFIIFSLIFKSIKSTFRKSKKSEEKEIEQTEKVDRVTYTYTDLENRIKLAAERYQNDNYQGTLESTETIILKYQILKENGYISSKLIDPNDSSEECNGYVKFIKQEAKISYIPYIKCSDNYKTEGYYSSYTE